MNQVTRCPHCYSIFRAYEHDLNQAQGWVRCGSCEKVFHGKEHTVNWNLELTSVDSTEIFRIQPMPEIDLNLPSILDFPVDEPLSARTERSQPADHLVKISTNDTNISETFFKINKIIQYYVLKLFNTFIPILISLILFIAIFLQIGFHFRYKIFDLHPWIYDFSIPKIDYSLRNFCDVYNCHLNPIKKASSLSIRFSHTLSVNEGSITDSNPYITIQLNGNIKNISVLDIKIPHFEIIIKDHIKRIISRKVLKASEFKINNRSIKSQEDLEFSARFQLHIPSDQEIKSIQIQPFYP